MREDCHIIFRKLSLVLCAATFILSACDPDISVDRDTAQDSYSNGEIKVERFYAIGDEKTAGFHDNELFFSGQLNSFPSLLHRQFALLGDHPYTFPSMFDEAGLGGRIKLGYDFDCNQEENLTLVPFDRLPNSRNFGRNTLSRVHNLGVPGLRVNNITSTRLSEENPYWHRMSASDDESYLAHLSKERPSFFTVWIGLNDVLQWAMSGGLNPLDEVPYPTTEFIFRPNLAELLDTLTRDTNTRGLIGNLPRITDFPFFEVIPRNALELTAEQAEQLNLLYIAYPTITFQEGKNNFVVNDGGIPRHILESERILLSVDLDSIKCGGYGSVIPFGSNDVLLVDEIEIIDQTLSTYNRIIEEEAARRDIPVVDFFSWYVEIQQQGIRWNGVDTGFEFVTGGFFSLDGVNPTQRGSALIANAWLMAIEEEYRLKLPLLNPTEFSGVNLP